VSGRESTSATVVPTGTTSAIWFFTCPESDPYRFPARSTPPKIEKPCVPEEIAIHMAAPAHQDGRQSTTGSPNAEASRSAMIRTVAPTMPTNTLAEAGSWSRV
jgi:hypothetical protein